MNNNGNKSFEDFFKEYLNAYSKSGMEGVYQLIEENALSENASTILKDAFRNIDHIFLASKELAEFKNAGGATREWEVANLDDLTID